MIGEQNLKKKKVSSILFGVNGESKGYGMFDLVSKRSIVRIHVIFKEDFIWSLNAM